MDRNDVVTSGGKKAVDVLKRNREMAALAQVAIGFGIAPGSLTSRLESQIAEVEEANADIEKYITDKVRGAHPTWRAPWDVGQGIHDDLRSPDIPDPSKALEGLQALVAIAQEEE